MNLKSVVPSSLALLLVGLTPCSFAATEAETIAKARASYPLRTCVVSDEKLDNMDEAVPYIHRVQGKPDRVIFFCCDGCIDDFKQDPAKYLKKLDAAAKAKPPAKTGRPDGR